MLYPADKARALRPRLTRSCSFVDPAPARPAWPGTQAERRAVHLARIDAASPRALAQPSLTAPRLTRRPSFIESLPGAKAVDPLINAYGPASFSARLKATLRLLRAHPEYAEALGAMWMHRAGSGMLVGSFMVLISGLGTASPVQPVMTLAIVDLLSHILPPVVSLHGAHLRDDADASARIGLRTTPSNYAKGILWTAVGDGTIAAAMFALAWQVAYHGLAGPWLLVPLGILRMSQTCLGFYEFNMFNAFKTRLPPPELVVDGTNQHYTVVSSGIRFVVLSMEATIGATVFSVATASVVFAAESLIHSAMFHPVALTGIAIGGLMAAVPKAVFLPYIRQNQKS